MTSSSERMEGWVQAAQNIKDEQRTVAGKGDRAVIAWMGYDAPPAPPDLGVFNQEAAEAGASKLAASIRGLDAVRAGNMPRTNVLAHSYGTTTASLGLTQAGVHVDNFVSIASAGIPQSIPTADEIQADHVYAGQARDTLVGFRGFGDQYAYIGRDFSVPYRLDPTNDSFGAETFGADGAVVDTPAGPQQLRGVKDHGVWTKHHEGYLDVGTESLRNVALATTGNGDRVSPAR
ncbi:alpha/beta hydrolase family protein [Curtobacterium sp. MCSS17_008]|uniref:alpha/beta hydrolase family protein n=1 Tax=Curtobacterium sp. MCSS17_008 TaxID=2175647 RepID=UPI0021ACE566|nr:alpha/beta hydrolase family protein [Curtobacterium sp. MCSS17_008]